MRVVRDLSGFLCSCFQGRSPHLELRPEHQVSSPVPTWISGFLWGFRRKSGLASLETCKSILFSSWESSVRLPVVFT